MIGILQNKNLNSARLQSIIDKHYLNICKTIKRSKTYNMPCIENDIKKYTAGTLTFEIIIKANYPAIKAIINKYGKYTKSVDKYKILFNCFRKNYGDKLVKSLELSVCPYCNRNFINSSADIDHFFPKTKYTVFSLSFFNLIPVCSVCNRKKNNNDIYVSPYDCAKQTDSIIKFIPFPKSITEFSPKIKPLVREMQSNVDVLKLEDSYEIHSDLIAELYFKTLKYPKNYIKYLGELALSPVKVNMSPQEFHYGNYLKESNYYKRPLSKMTKDMIDCFRKYREK